jgi:hypothetical protein
MVGERDIIRPHIKLPLVDSQYPGEDMACVYTDTHVDLGTSGSANLTVHARERAIIIIMLLKCGH